MMLKILAAWDRLGLLPGINIIKLGNTKFDNEQYQVGTYPPISGDSVQPSSPQVTAKGALLWNLTTEILRVMS